MKKISELTAIEVTALFRAKELGPVEYLTQVWEHIDRWEPSLNAFYIQHRESSLAGARESEARYMAGAPLSEIDGVPTTVKEMLASAGDADPSGSVAGSTAPATTDSPVVARLKEAGALILGKTTVPDYGMLSSGLSSLHGITRNPWDLNSNTGGSSSGAGAAAAANYGPLHVGSDIGGSVRIPAGWCGVVGFKPSHGRIPVDPYYFGRCAGPMTRTVADTALAMQFLSKPDSRDATSLKPEQLPWKVRAANVSGMRVGLLLDAGCGMKIDDEVVATVLSVARMFEAQGAVVSEVGPILTQDQLDGLDTFWRARTWSSLEQLSPEKREQVLPYIWQWAERAQQSTGLEVVRGFAATYEMRKQTNEVFEHVDIVLAPTNPVVKYPAHLPSPTNDPSRPFDHIALTMPWNMGEQPAISINGGYSEEGFPIGIQIIGPRFADIAVLEAATAVEAWLKEDQRPFPLPQSDSVPA